ncbi:MAG TPA: bifunctional phosphoribosylaminoimidazolecarboxamide formyltransferase/IMP cyclohydrolase [Trueperaceae bacterium]|nr:bifunctional phosphoribosylaminoimidazolecarboxamide formyltransferase/IMP cyclohydrolase [Trueperaceae bacterium]
MPRALLSVSDKRGVADFARGLSALGYEIVSTGGTLASLRQAGVEAVAVADVTGFPEILDGRVKTLHPNIHGGLLARRDEAHLAELRRHGITPIDVVAVNLYPFRETVARPDVTWQEALENIDIGGPTMVRAAAKNHPSVLVVVDPDDYESVLLALEKGADEDLRRRLARKAFAHTAAYDAAIVAWMERDQVLPEHLDVALERVEELRYGENPHQQGARYREVGKRGWWDGVTQHSGMALSYLNLFDAEAAWRLAFELGAGRAAVIAKHANPCGAAVADDLATAYAAAFEADPKSAFGGVVALPGGVDLALAQRIVGNPKADVLIAREYAPEALELFARKRKNMRVLQAEPPGPRGLELRRVDAGFLVQQPDPVAVDRAAWRVVTRAQPTEAQWRDLELAYRVCAYTTSNAIVFAAGGSAVAVGAGQQSRVDAVEIAAKKAAGRAAGGACASDAFFPFRDGVDAAADAGVSAVVQPGGSIRDEEVIAAADERGLAMVLTGERHFRH